VPDNRPVPIKDIAALVLGLGIAIVIAVLADGVRETPDESMRWEGGVAVGFTAMIFVGPFWIAQAVLTVLATVDGTGIAPGWLWAWLFLAPAVGASPLATGPVRLAKRLRRNAA
jgi:MFS family permease